MAVQPLSFSRAQRTTLNRVFVVLVLLLFLPVAGQADYNPIERVSVATNGVEGTGDSFNPSITTSADGRYVAFESRAEDLVSGDSNASSDIFVYDRQADTIERVSVDDGGTPANADSTNASISSTGQFVAFQTDATNLFAADNNSSSDVLVYDRTADTIDQISVDDGGLLGNGDSSNPSINTTGRYVVYESDATNLVAGDGNGSRDIFLFDRDTDTVELISVDSAEDPANGDSFNPSVSTDGRYVVFESDATDLVGDDTNGKRDIFLRDRTAGTTERISVNSDEIETDDDSFNPVIDVDNGNLVAFSSTATNLVADDTNGVSDIFVRNVGAGTTSRASVNSDEIQGNSGSFMPALSSDGRYVLFESDATNLGTQNDVNGSRDVFVRDQTDGNTALVSVEDNGDQANAASAAGALNSNANFAAFSSDATDLDSENIDGNSSMDVFVINLQCLIEPAGVVADDTDSDGTKDCDDDCPTDNAKVAEGQCGCGNVDTDTDGDGTADCNDGCPSDINKTSEGVCGCGVADTDSNSNGVEDCNDPTASTRPKRPRVRPRRGAARVIIPQEFQNVSYRIIVKRNGRRVARKNTRRQRVIFRNLQSGQYYVVRYKVALPGGGFSRASRKRRFRVR